MTLDIIIERGIVSSDGTADGVINSWTVPAGQLWYVEVFELHKSADGALTDYYLRVRHLDSSGNIRRSARSYDGSATCARNNISGFYAYENETLVVRETEDSGAGEENEYRLLGRRIL